MTYMEKREWKTIKEFEDILFDFYGGIARITINRPRWRNARPKWAKPCASAARCPRCGS